MFEGADVLTNNINKLFIVNFVDGATLNIDTTALVVNERIELENYVEFAEKATLFQCVEIVVGLVEAVYVALLDKKEILKLIFSFDYLFTRSIITRL